MTVALDTNAYTDFMKGVPARVQVVQSAARLHLPLIVLAELRPDSPWGASNRRTRQTCSDF